MAAYSCDKCAGLGILSASRVFDEENNRTTGIEIVMCDHYDEATEQSIEALTSTGLALQIVKPSKSTDVRSQPEEEEETTNELSIELD